MEAIQQTLVVFFVLALLGGSLYWLRSKGMAQFSLKGMGRSTGRRMQVVERMSLTPQHSLHLVTVGGRTVLIAASPGGVAVVDGKWDEVSQ